MLRYALSTSKTATCVPGGGGFSDQKITLGERAPLAREISRINFGVDGRSCRVVPGEGKILNYTIFIGIRLRDDAKRSSAKGADES